MKCPEKIKNAVRKVKKRPNNCIFLEKAKKICLINILKNTASKRFSMGVLANALSNIHSAVLGDFKGAAGRADGVSVEADPRDPEKKVLRFGKGKDDIFPVEGGGPAVEGMRKIFSKWIESPSQLQKIRDLPLEDRPVLMFEYTGLATGGYCNGERIVLNPVLGTGYSAAGILAHEFQHQYQ